MKREEVPSPCINVCSVDDDTGLCRGCYRSLDEVTRWPRMDNAAKREVLALLEGRKKEFADIMRPY